MGTEPGVKFDGKKSRPSLVIRSFARALEVVVRVGTHGAEKYSPEGWYQVENAEERYMDALLRHLLQDSYEEIDPDSGLPHLGHAAWNILCVLELRLRRVLVDGTNGVPDPVLPEDLK